MNECLVNPEGAICLLRQGTLNERCPPTPLFNYRYVAHALMPTQSVVAWNGTLTDRVNVNHKAIYQPGCLDSVHDFATRVLNTRDDQKALREFSTTPWLESPHYVTQLRGVAHFIKSDVLSMPPASAAIGAIPCLLLQGESAVAGSTHLTHSQVRLF